MAVRDQLIEQIGLQIASGLLKGTEKLPSIRALAQRLGIHHSTVTSAYSHLAEVGLLEIRQGSGVRVAARSPAADADENTGGTAALFSHFLSQAVELGLSRQELLEHCQKILSNKPVVRILAVDRNVDFHKLLLFELQPHFTLPVQPITPEDLRKQPDLLATSFIISSLYHVFPLQGIPIDPTRFVVCNIEPGREQMEVINKLPPTSIVMLVSMSPTLLKMARNVAAALRGEEIAVRTIAPNEQQEIKYMMQHVKAVICDSPSYDSVKALAGKTPVHEFHLYSQSTIELIKNRLAKWG